MKNTLIKQMTFLFLMTRDDIDEYLKDLDPLAEDYIDELEPYAEEYIDELGDCLD